ncbi:MAG: hypothetical protein LBB74_05765 [Chitinispirillales bacterium]|jgi:hypothetical protein|nr:hypothetical protein [Chitinispirillales bacterium]
MSRRKFETDLTSNLLTAEARGEMRSRLSMAAKLKAKGMEINTIIEVTELSVDEILKA